MNSKQIQQIVTYLKEIDSLQFPIDAYRWSKRVAEFLRHAGGQEVADLFENYASTTDDSFDIVALQQGYLEGLVAKADEKIEHQIGDSFSQDSAKILPVVTNTRKVFIVHGHDGEAKEVVARFLEKLDLDPIILHEQPNQGRTIIEKFEISSSDVAFAVVLLTPDDIGGSAGTAKNLHSRARQNVILELGYFMGRLGRTRVCALYKGDVELPSDYQGIIYLEFDSSGAWKTKLAQEFVQAKLTINLQGLIS